MMTSRSLRFATRTASLGLGLLIALRLSGCDGSVEPADSNGSSASGGGLTDAGGASNGGNEATGGSLVGDGDDSDPCDDLIESAGWQRGDTIESTAVSTPERMTALGTETWNLSLRLMDLVPSTEEANIANSATSFYTALGMMTEAHCAERIEETLNFPESGNDFHNTIGAALREIGQRAISETDASDGLTVNFVNSIWRMGVTELPTEEHFGDVATLYGAQPNATEALGDRVRDVMNCAIERDSQGLLVDFLPPGWPDVLQTTATINVSYLASPWLTKMNEFDVDFAQEGDATSQVPGMGYSMITLPRYDAETFSTVELPLLGGELRVLFAVPNDTFTGTTDEFVASLTSEMLDEARMNAAPQYMRFQMPQVTVDSTTIDYYPLLEFECRPFTLENVFHGAAVEMDPEGIKAAAATVAIGDGDAAPEPPEDEFIIDRPFVFFVYDPETTFALFSGRFMEP